MTQQNVMCTCGVLVNIDMPTVVLDEDGSAWHIEDDDEFHAVERRCERCRKAKLTTEFPEPHRLGGKLRPFCIPCTNYVYWATS
jgi:hypothetical protein